MEFLCFYLIILNLCLVAPFILKNSEKSKDHKLLLILLDGFRWDYINYTKPNGGFKRFVKNGVQAEYMDPLYPSESFPGYYAITTGLYGESHGIPLNYMYDESRNVFFKMMPHEESDMSFWWEKAEPLWVTTTRQNIPTASLLWPGGHILINGRRPAIFTPYERKYYVRTFHQNLERALKLFATEEIKYAQVYCEYTDVLGHSMGPDIVKEGPILAVLDGIIAQMLDSIVDKGLEDKLNIVIVSDHGMTETDRFNVKTIELGKIISHDEVSYVLDRGSHVGIYPAEGYKEKIIDKLKGIEGLSVYKREEIPEQFHMKTDRVPPIFVQAHKGYYISGLLNDEKQVPRDAYDWQWFGFHGYDHNEDKDMRGIFFAKGPDIKKNIITPPIDIVDPYNLLATLLGIQPLPNNGTWSRVKDMLV